MDVERAFPLTLRHLGDTGPSASSREEFVQAVCDAHPLSNIPHRAVRDLVHHESLLAELPPAPTRRPGALPSEEEACRLGTHVRLLVFGAGLPEMIHSLRAGAPATPRPARGWLILYQGSDGAPRERWVLREAGWFVERFREPTTPRDAIEDDEDRALFEALWREGILVRA